MCGIEWLLEAEMSSNADAVLKYNKRKMLAEARKQNDKPDARNDSYKEEECPMKDVFAGIQSREFERAALDSQVCVMAWKSLLHAPHTES